VQFADPSCAPLTHEKALDSMNWVFCSREGTRLSSGDALKRYIRPVAKERRIGLHDFRHYSLHYLLRVEFLPSRIGDLTLTFMMIQR